MKSVFSAVILFSVTTASAAGISGQAVYEVFDEGRSASIVVKGEAARAMYEALDVPAILVDWVELRAMAKRGRDISCFSLTEKVEYSCAIRVSDTAKGSVD